MKINEPEEHSLKEKDHLHFSNTISISQINYASKNSRSTYKHLIDKQNIVKNSNTQMQPNQNHPKIKPNQPKQELKKQFPQNTLPSASQSNIVIQKQRTKIAVLLKMLNQLHSSQFIEQKNFKLQRDEYKYKFQQLLKTNNKMNQLMEKLKQKLKAFQTQSRINQQQNFINERKKYQNQLLQMKEQIIQLQNRCEQNKTKDKMNKQMSYLASKTVDLSISYKGDTQNQHAVQQLIPIQNKTINGLSILNLAQSKLSKQFSNDLQKFQPQISQQQQAIIYRLLNKANVLEQQLSSQKQLYYKVLIKYQKMQSFMTSKFKNKELNEKYIQTQEDNNAPVSSCKQNKKIVLQQLLIQSLKTCQINQNTSKQQIKNKTNIQACSKGIR